MSAGPWTLGPILYEHGNHKLYSVEDKPWVIKWKESSEEALEINADILGAGGVGVKNLSATATATATRLYGVEKHHMVVTIWWC